MGRSWLCFVQSGSEFREAAGHALARDLLGASNLPSDQRVGLIGEHSTEHRLALICTQFTQRLGEIYLASEFDARELLVIKLDSRHPEAPPA
jgi:hypothetical protein